MLETETLEGLAIVISLAAASIVAVFFIAWVITDRPPRSQIKQAAKEAVYITLGSSALMFGWFAFNIWTGGSTIWPTLVVLCIIVALYLASTAKED
jgi:ammonia channel protein AmtB